MRLKADWLRDQLLFYVRPGCVAVVDIAVYHSRNSARGKVLYMAVGQEARVHHSLTCATSQYAISDVGNFLKVKNK